MTIARAIYLLCAATSLLAAGLLLRQYRFSRTRLLLWSVIAFVGLAINNVLVVVDIVLLPSIDLALLRSASGAVALGVLLYALVWGLARMMAGLVTFLQGVCAAEAWAVGLFFLRFWLDQRDRLFGYFGVAFWMMALNWTLLAIFNPATEAQPYLYAIRLVAFLLIVVAIVGKNRQV